MLKRSVAKMKRLDATRDCRAAAAWRRRGTCAGRRGGALSCRRVGIIFYLEIVVMRPAEATAEIDKLGESSRACVT